MLNRQMTRSSMAYIDFRKNTWMLNLSVGKAQHPIKLIKFFLLKYQNNPLIEYRYNVATWGKETKSTKFNASTPFLTSEMYENVVSYKKTHVPKSNQLR